MHLYPRQFPQSISCVTLPATTSMVMNKTCLKTYNILDDVDIVVDNVESAMHADIDAENAQIAESIFTFSATIPTAMFNTCNNICKFQNM